MTPGIGFALVAMVLFGASDLIYKRAATTGLDSGQFVMLQSWVFFPGIALYAFLTGTLEPHPAALWGSLAGLFSLVAFYNFAASLREGAVSTVAPIFRLNFTLTAALAIVLLGETVTPAKIVALACALVAVWLLLGEPAAARQRADRRTLARVLLATAAMACANFFYKVGVQHGVVPETMVTFQGMAFSTTATLMIFLRDRRLRLMPSAWRYSAPAALALVTAFVLLMHGLAKGPASVLVPVAQMSFVLTAALGAVIFRERWTARKSGGLLVAAAALALFAVS